MRVFSSLVRVTELNSISNSAAHIFRSDGVARQGNSNSNIGTARIVSPTYRAHPTDVCQLTLLRAPASHDDDDDGRTTQLSPWLQSAVWLSCSGLRISLRSARPPLTETRSPSIHAVKQPNTLKRTRTLCPRLSLFRLHTVPRLSAASARSPASTPRLGTSDASVRDP
jgi:hypothetical protein